jgi:hypothetical protein
VQGKTEVMLSLRAREYAAACCSLDYALLMRLYAGFEHGMQGCAAAVLSETSSELSLRAREYARWITAGTNEE